MSQVLNVYDGGLQKINGGHTVGVVIFGIVTGEGTPEKLIGYCRPNHQDAVIKSLKRLVWNSPNYNPVKPKPQSVSKDNS